jgi:hypothetical protein
MGDVVELHPADLRDNHEFITDLARFSEGLVSEAAIKKRYYFTDEIWSKLGDDDELIRAVEDEKLRRIRSGATKRERAQQLVVRAPDVLAGILDDAAANPRHRIDSARVLDDFAANGPAAVPAADRFQIVINLGADSDGKPVIETYDKSIAIKADDTPAPAAIPAIAATQKRPRGQPRKIVQSDDDADTL